jgi:hypothetical protein
MYQFDQLKDKYLWAKTSVNTYAYPNGHVEKVVYAGQLVGMIFGWVEREGEIWFQLWSGQDGEQYNGASIPLGNAPTWWIKWEQGKFDEQKIREQGAQTLEETNAKGKPLMQFLLRYKNWIFGVSIFIFSLFYLKTKFK